LEKVKNHVLIHFLALASSGIDYDVKVWQPISTETNINYEEIEHVGLTDIQSILFLIA
jgi:hypothetical protein